MERRERKCVMRILSLALLLAATPVLVAQERVEDADAVETMSIAVPRAPLELVEVRSFTVEKPMEFSVEGKKAEIKKGHVLVLKVDLEMTEPLNLPDRYLLVGGCVAQKINSGYKDGVVVVVVNDLDLERAQMWFGSRWLPRTFNERALARERESVGRTGIKPFTKKQIQRARERGGELVEAYDLNELWFMQRDLVLKYAPAEREMALSLHPGPDAVAWRAAKGR